MSIAAGYSHLLYQLILLQTTALLLMTKMDALSSNLSNRLLFFDMWFKKLVNEDDARRLIIRYQKCTENFLNIEGCYLNIR